MTDVISVQAEDELEAMLKLSTAEQWGDGLPFIPPTRERVERALSAIDIDPDHVLGSVAPSGSDATIRTVTINAIMAGCAVEHLPLVFAATEALCRPSFNLRVIQVTTHPVGVGAFVSGPLGAKLGVNSGSGSLGPGNRANATVGRAIRLILRNIGGALPGDADKSTFGSPANYSWFFGENQAVNPWASWAERSGAAPGESVVAVYPSGGYYNFLETTASADELITAIARGMGGPACNDMLFCGSPLLIMGGEHASVLADAGLTIEDVQHRLWDEARLPVHAFSGSAQKYRLGPAWTRFLGELSQDTLIPVSEKPEDIRIVVSGGEGRHTVYVPVCLSVPQTQAALDPYVNLMRL